MRPALVDELVDRALSPEDEAAQLSLLQGFPVENENGEPEPDAFDFAEHFWLKKPYYAEEFAEVVCRRFSEHVEWWEGSAIGSAIWSAYRSYHNLGSADGDPLTQLQEGGEAGELLALAIPHYRTLVRHQISLFTAHRPEWDPQARTSDAQGARQVPMCSNLLDYVAASSGLDSRLAEQVELMMVAGAGYFITGWDPNAGLDGTGWFTQRICAPWELCHERVRVYDDATWWIHRAFESRWDWVARFAESDPDKARRIAELDDAGDFASSFREYGDTRLGIDNDEEGDRIAVLYLVAKPTIACPEGRLAIVCADDLVLLDGPYPYGRDITVSRMCASEFLGTSIPYADSWGVLAAADAANAIISMILTRVDTCGVPNFCVPEGSELDFSDIAGGNNVWKVTPGGEKPSVVDLLQLPDSLPAILGLISSLMEQTVGINSVTKGQPQENVSSGSMAALLQNMAIQFNSNLERAWILNLERIGTHHVRVFQRMASEPLSVSVMGQDNRWSVTSFKGEELGGILKVSVKTASALAKTTAGRAEIADKLLQRSAITPQEYLRIIQTGQLQPTFQGPVGELTGIKARAEKLLRGEPAPAMTWDNHQLCIRELKGLLNTEARDDVQIAGVINQAVQQHFELWSQLSREAPDMLAAIGCPPLPQALQIGQQAQMMQAQGMGPGMPPMPPGAQGPGPQQQKQPETDAPRGRPGPNPAPKGQPPSQTQPTEPKPAKTPQGESVTS